MSLPWLIRSAGWFSGSPAGRPVDRAAELSGGERLRGFPVQFGKARQQPRLGLPEAMQAEGTQASGSPWIAEIGVDPGCMRYSRLPRLEPPSAPPNPAAPPPTR